MHQGLVEKSSAHSVEETINRLETLLREKGFMIVARVDHAKAAASVDMALQACQLLIFGNPSGGTPLMQANIRSAIDLPLKALAYKNDQGQTMLAYNDPEYLAHRHQLDHCDKPLAMMTAGLKGLTDKACEAA